MSTRDKKITIEATFDQWCEMVKSLDTCCDMTMMFRKLVKANPEARGAKELLSQFPEMVMAFQEQMSFLKQSLVRDLSVEDVQALVEEEREKADSRPN